ncbi:MAG: hypothetical protein N3E51_00005 [Candidatus Micrarchaeota archaeon]|nr:hypothetical protein [Candidatus Micrarchaeota archaeon]
MARRKQITPSINAIGEIVSISRSFGSKQPLSEQHANSSSQRLSTAIGKVAAEAKEYLKEKAASNKKRKLIVSLNSHSFDGRVQLAVYLADRDGNCLGKVANMELSLNGFVLYDAEGTFHGKRSWTEFEAAVGLLAGQLERFEWPKRLC